MSQIFINHTDVQAQTANLRSEVAAKLSETESAFSNLQSSLNTKDSATNARFLQAVDVSTKKAQSAARGLTKVINFVSGSAEQMRLEDMRLAAVMQQQER